MYRKFDSKLGSTVLTIFAGELYVTNKNEIISTILGSCVSVCLYDSELGIGGMNHFMLPDNSGGIAGQKKNPDILKRDELSEKSTRYGISAMEVLISEMQKKGAGRKNLQAKVFGGGRVLKSMSNTESIGDRNIGFTRAFLKLEGIKIDRENVGETFGRKIFFLVGKNRVFMKKVAIEPAVSEERKYMKQLLELRNKADITLF